MKKITLKVSLREEALALLDLMRDLIETKAIRIEDQERFGKAVIAHIEYHHGFKIDPETGEAK